MDRRHFLAGAAALALPRPGQAQPGAQPGGAQSGGALFGAAPEALARLHARLLRLEEDGLDPRWYGLDAAEPGSAAPAAPLALADLVAGRAAVQRADLGRDPAANPVGPWLVRLAESAEPAEVIELAAILHPQAPALRAALAAARARAARPPEPVPAAGGTLEPGAADPGRAPALRARLLAEDPLLAEAPDGGDLYDAALVEAVRRFQAGAGLEPDGRVGLATFGALNRSPLLAVEQFRVALDMRRGLAAPARERRVEVNIPDFRLQVLDAGRTLLEMAVVVGRPARATPVMRTRLASVQFNPPWGVPQRLASEDMLPRLRRDPQALAQRGIRVFGRIGGEVVEIDPLSVDWHAIRPDRFPFFLRQDAGELNALGRLKFVMPNGEDIFLHDTPERQHFRRPARAYSSGCIRLERPMDLLVLLLDGMSGWGRERADQILASRATSVVALRRPLPIRLHYTTAVVAGNEVRLRPDIYGLDEAWARAMERGPRIPVASRG